MKIAKIKILNYRSIGSLELKFPTYYSAISGKNNAGKTNLIRALRSVFKEEYVYFRIGEDEINYKRDFPLWKTKEEHKSESVEIEVELTVNKELDSSLYNFILALTSRTTTSPEIALCTNVTVGREDKTPKVVVTVDGEAVSEYHAEEIVKKVQSTHSVMYYNSTEPEQWYISQRRFSGLFSNISPVDKKQIDTVQENFQKAIKRIAQKHQKDLEELLGRLEEKYKVSLNIPSLDTNSIPFHVSLGNKNADVALEEWGSGTQNRTLILLTLFQARKVSEVASLASRITPVILIEEPESFLHPSAQAEFGRILQDLSEEFKVQVIATTHSPYMLSQANPEANILFNREVQGKTLGGTKRIDTSGENWMEPFAMSLGINNSEFGPWRDLFFTKENRILLVEGDIDVKYWKLLQDTMHGSNQLEYNGEIVSYDGVGSLSNTVLLRFVKGRYRRFFVTYDLDAEIQIIKQFNALELIKHKHFLPVGKNQAGKKDIEGLLPDRIRASVYSAHPNLVAALCGNTQERKDAKQSLKQLLFEEFSQQARPGEDYAEFYKAAKIIDKALKE
jgi:putative ATP-dependent endonuclease of the OLD family